jgi:very-short-patch-repair endonuclease
VLVGSQEAHQRARKLRKELTKPERLFWWALKAGKTGWHFRRQHAAGSYILDFYCHTGRLCVEVDGPAHEFRREHDRRRDALPRGHGVRTLRVCNEEVLGNLTGVVKTIVEALQTPPSACG